jgi:hypothetical protein
LGTGTALSAPGPGGGVKVGVSVPVPVLEGVGVLLPVWEGEPDTLGVCDCVKPVDSDAVADGVPDGLALSEGVTEGVALMEGGAGHSPTTALPAAGHSM